MRAICLAVAVSVGFQLRALCQELPTADGLASKWTSIAARAVIETDRDAIRTMLGRQLRNQIELVNQTSSAEWRKISTRAEWELLCREKIEALRKSLGDMPVRNGQPPILVTGTFQGNGFEVRNLVFESRPGLAVTANLYVPQPPRATMPGLLLSHSHHNPKEQGELQDMGMTWARAGCYVLVPDHLGHGERRQHPFVTAADYPAPFQIGRQDYYFRYDTGLQLYLAGESLMGWLAHDLMRGVDVLLAQPAIDAKRIAILGSVAGGGEAAAVTAALDERIACACPFNFGGPQPETPYPLPENAEAWFNYAGSGSWESTRNLYRSAKDGFLPWIIVASIAPRHLIHAHEFAWDGPRDPVWKRYQAIWGLFNAEERLSVAYGQGTLISQDPPGSHCNNIGAVHRRPIHEAFRRWLNIEVRPEDEYTQRRSADQLACLTEEAKHQLQPRLLHELLFARTSDGLAAARKVRALASLQERREQMREVWSRFLGDSESTQTPKVMPGSPIVEQQGDFVVRRETLETDPGILVPVTSLAAGTGYDWRPTPKLLVVLADDGIGGVLARRGDEIRKRLLSGWTIVIPEVRGTGTSASGDEGPQSASTSHSATSLMLGTPLLGSQLRDVRAVWQHVRPKASASGLEVAVLGDCGSKTTDSDEPNGHPHRVNSRPAEVQAGGALLALLFALLEDDVTTIEIGNGLLSFQSLLESPFVQIPHRCIIPGILKETDISDLVAALAPRKVRVSGLVDGRGRRVNLARARAAYAVAIQCFQAAGAQDNLEFSELDGSN